MNEFTSMYAKLKEMSLSPKNSEIGKLVNFTNKCLNNW